MTFAQFQASRRETNNLPHELGMNRNDGVENCGFVYGNDSFMLYIEEPSWGMFRLVLMNDIEESIDLPKLERILYDWGVDEGVITTEEESR